MLEQFFVWLLGPDLAATCGLMALVIASMTCIALIILWAARGVD